MSTTSSSINVKWVNSTLMIGRDSRGRTIVLGNDSDSDPEWIGLKPSDLLLIAAASCSAYDVINILKKQREPALGLEIICEGVQLSDPPNTFVEIKLKYKINGQVNEDKVKKAIHLSEEKYCSVLSTLRLGVSIESKYEVLD